MMHSQSFDLGALSLAGGIVYDHESFFGSRALNQPVLTARANMTDISALGADLYADRIGKDFGFLQHYATIPLKGIYLKFMHQDKPIRTNIYPVPNLKNPFLGAWLFSSRKNYGDYDAVGSTFFKFFWFPRSFF